ncbi:MAG: hypothetical protein K5751_08570 [Treponemataceae bacterium]|nr:hypothetical protein [Treponemataceae bacterium]
MLKTENLTMTERNEGRAIVKALAERPPKAAVPNPLLGGGLKVLDFISRVFTEDCSNSAATETVEIQSLSEILKTLPAEARQTALPLLCEYKRDQTQTRETEKTNRFFIGCVCVTIVGGIYLWTKKSSK